MHTVIRNNLMGGYFISCVKFGMKSMSLKKLSPQKLLFICTFFVINDYCSLKNTFIILPFQVLHLLPPPPLWPHPLPTLGRAPCQWRRRILCRKSLVLRNHRNQPHVKRKSRRGGGGGSRGRSQEAEGQGQGQEEGWWCSQASLEFPRPGRAGSGWVASGQLLPLAPEHQGLP